MPYPAPGTLARRNTEMTETEKKQAEYLVVTRHHMYLEVNGNAVVSALLFPAGTMAVRDDYTERDAAKLVAAVRGEHRDGAIGRWQLVRS